MLGWDVRDVGFDGIFKAAPPPGKEVLALNGLTASPVSMGIDSLLSQWAEFLHLSDISDFSGPYAHD